ncbi:hypothetical protein [Klenkia brasiliensis]|uniref:Lipoprotein n=1 Tax=Klenkia brasiliensis TaxID=333142 RepID=A0A1G7QIV2_9ACTN|nr:hypothetical protein [Klenkia brasiliensis]SDF97550.1 hypothetical protein SAMN05660324_1474 [Klenkia brasiliensis]
MRRALPAALTAAALLLLPGCGGSDDGGAAAPSSSAAASPTGTAGGTAGADAAFCQQAQVALRANQQAVADAQADPAQLSSVLTQATDQLEAVTPPEAVAADWQTLVDAGRQLAQAVQGVDVTTPEGQQAVAGTLQQVGAAVGPASTRVQTYLADTCGIVPPPTATG